MPQEPPEVAFNPADSVVLIQECEGPAFRCRTDNGINFACEDCGHVLIENYRVDDFIGVGIQCFKCSKVNFTPVLPDGEVFAPHIVSLGEKGLYKLSDTVETWPGVIISCSEAIAAAYRLCQPRNEMFPFDFSNDGLAALVTKYDEITGGKFEVQDRKLARSFEAGDALKYPFAWSVRYLRRCLEDGVFNVDSLKSRTALMWLSMFRHSVGRWQHHPRFMKIAQDIGKPDSFLHTTSQLIVADYLFSHGNHVGLSLEEKQGEPNPDLYIRGALDNRAYLEVKAPRKLQAVQQQHSSLAFVDGAIKSSIDSSVGQINKRRVGALVIFSSLYDEQAAPEIERCISNWLRHKGRNRKSLAAVVSLSVNENAIGRIGKDAFSANFVLKVEPILNPHFDGANPINLRE